VSQYASQRDGAWRLWYRRDSWKNEIWHAVRQSLAQERQTKHPRTAEIRVAEAEQRLFLKIFFPSSFFGSLKDCFRRSRAVHTLLITEHLAAAGFNVPTAIGAGEERHAGVLRRSFVVTLPVTGYSLPHFLRQRFDAQLADLSARQKGETVFRLAREIRRFHDLGFIHGDLVPGNIFLFLDTQRPATPAALAAQFGSTESFSARRHLVAGPHAFFPSLCGTRKARADGAPVVSLVGAKNPPAPQRMRRRG
jgi:serine/threonine protein kinase